MNKQQIIDMYVNEKLSTYVIAQQFNTYPNKIRRILKSAGIELNDKSTAQKLALETGRTQHPTMGKKRDQKTKNKISESVFENWSNISEKNRQQRVDKCREQWYNMTEEERKSLRASAAQAVRQAAKDGSKMENFLKDSLPQHGYDVLFHKKGLIPNDDLEIDIFIPVLNVAVEIDGPSHFFPIWGEDSLQRHVLSDAKKSGLLLSCGFVVIRVKHLTKNLSEKHKRDTLNGLLIILEKIKEKFPPKQYRFIELDVK